MIRTHASVILLLLIAGAAEAITAPSRVVSQHRAAVADTLYRRACARLERHSVDERVAALAELEESCRLDPQRADSWLALGRTCLESGRFGRARQSLRQVTGLAVSDEAWLLLGRAWQHDWLATIDGSSLDQAMACFTRARTLAPARAEAWAAEATLRLLRGQTRLGLDAALHAADADPDDVEPLLLIGAACFRAGLLEEADRAFAAALPRVSPELRRRLDGDLARGTPPSAGADEWAPPEAAFAWNGADPDLTTPENEALLDYRARVTLATFLFRDGDQIRWDQRTELFVRYGPPAAIDFNPASAQVGRDLATFVRRRKLVEYAPPELRYPYDLQVWVYPDLGFAVALWDRSLSQHYEYPYSEDRDMDPRPVPGAIDGRTDLVALQDGLGVFRSMPPGATVVPVTATVSQFPAADGVRVLAHVFAPGSPSDTLRGSWALVDGGGNVVARAAQDMTPSECDPGEQRVAEFSAPIPPGEYRLDLAVQGTRGRRGLAHRRVQVTAPAAEGPRLSDLVLVCDKDSPDAQEIRIEPETRPRVTARSMVVYFELDRLALDASGTARFAYTWSVHARGSRSKRRGAEAIVEVTREEENVGPHRRQFVTVPTADLPLGEFELRVEVRDLRTDHRATGILAFAR